MISLGNFADLAKQAGASGLAEKGVSELLSADFLKKHTSFSSVEDICKALNITSLNETVIQEKLGELNALIAKNSKFKSWDELLKFASQELLKNKLAK